MLEVKNLSAYYGAITGLRDVSLTCESETITCIIGSNGAGKTTLLKSISGMVSKTGEILWNGQSISGLTARKIAKLGIIQVPEGRHIFRVLQSEKIWRSARFPGMVCSAEKNFMRTWSEFMSCFPA